MARSSRRTLHAAACIAALLAPAVARGQSFPGALAPETRVRLELLAADSGHASRLARFARSDAQPLVGTFEGLRGDTVLLRLHAGVAPLRVPVSAIRGAYASRGRPSRWAAGLRSAVVPALVGGAFRGLGASVRDRDGGPTPVQAALTGAAISGAFAGAKGVLFPKERWQKLTQPSAPPAGPAVAARPGAEVTAVGTRPR